MSTPPIAGPRSDSAEDLAGAVEGVALHESVDGRISGMIGVVGREEEGVGGADDDRDHDEVRDGEGVGDDEDGDRADGDAAHDVGGKHGEPPRQPVDDRPGEEQQKDRRLRPAPR